MKPKSYSHGTALPLFPWFDGWRFGFVLDTQFETVFIGWYQKETR